MVTHAHFSNTHISFLCASSETCNCGQASTDLFHTKTSNGAVRILKIFDESSSVKRSYPQVAILQKVEHQKEEKPGF